MIASLALLFTGAGSLGIAEPHPPSRFDSVHVRSQQPLYRRQHAVLIGNNKCRAFRIVGGMKQEANLQFATADAKGFKAVLEGYLGFAPEDIRLILNGTKDEILGAVRDLASDRIGSDDLVVVFFAGHGVTVPSSTGEVGFLIPSDAAVDISGKSERSDYLSSCIPMDLFWRELELCMAKHQVLIADACFGGVAPRGHLRLEPKEQPIPRSIALAQLSVHSKLAMTAGSAKQRALELPEVRHGAFSASLLEALKEMGKGRGAIFGFDAAFARARRNLNGWAKLEQTPQLYATVTPEGTTPVPLFTANGIVPPPVAPGPATLLVIESSPPGASVFIGGTNTARTTPYEHRPSVDVGGDAHIEVRLELDGYEPATRSVPLRRGERVLERITLVPTIATETVDFVTRLVSLEPTRFEAIKGASIGPAGAFETTMAFNALPQAHLEINRTEHRAVYRTSRSWNPTSDAASKLFEMLNSACKPLLSKGWKLETTEKGLKRSYKSKGRSVVVHQRLDPREGLIVSLTVWGQSKK